MSRIVLLLTTKHMLLGKRFIRTVFSEVSAAARMPKLPMYRAICTVILHLGVELPRLVGAAHAHVLPRLRVVPRHAPVVLRLRGEGVGHLALQCARGLKWECDGFLVKLNKMTCGCRQNHLGQEKVSIYSDRGCLKRKRYPDVAVT